MGAQQSKTEVTNRILQKAVTNVAVSNQSRCTSNTFTNPKQVISNVRGCGNVSIENVTQDVNLAVEPICIQKVENKQQFLDQIKNAIQEEVKKEMEAGLFTYQGTDTQMETDIENIIQTDINLDNLNECLSQQTANPEQAIKDIGGWTASDCVEMANAGIPPGDINIKDISQTVAMRGAMECISKNVNKSEIVRKLETEKKFTEDTKIKGWDPLEWLNNLSFAVGIGSWIWVILIALPILLCISSSISSMLSGGSGGGGTTTLVDTSASAVNQMMPLLMASMLKK